MKYQFKNIKSYCDVQIKGSVECYIHHATNAGSTKKIFVDIPDKNVISAPILDIPYYFDSNTKTYKELTSESGCQVIPFHKQTLRVFYSETDFKDIEEMEA